MEKEQLPGYSRFDELLPRRRRRHGPPRIVKFLVLACIGYFVHTQWTLSHSHEPQILSAERLNHDYATCGRLRAVAHDPEGYRERSARYVDGNSAVFIRNATVWTGEPTPGTSKEDARAGIGYSWITADVLLEHGLVKRVERDMQQRHLPSHYKTYDAHGRQLTTGIVDMHSHAGVDTLPDLRGSSDDNELSNDITPYVRTIDALNPLDHQIQVIKSGGVTTSLILPGSGNNMGGEAFVIKHAVGKQDGRPELSVESMLADPEKHWRYMKMACGENAKSVYGRVGRDFGPFSRLGEAWYFRHAFEQASALVNAQNEWCTAADRLGVENMRSYLPQDLKWESLGALLRGQVLLNTHCYTTTDLETFVRHTNEFKFKVRAFHHAHSTYLVPEVLKRAFGGRPPAAALFADNMNYKAESYIASEQAGKILYENGITPVYVSDNPVINAQHVVFEAAKAYRNGLPYHVALAGVTSASAELLGLGERIGKVKAGFDADIVVWDSDPLSVGAAPVQVWIDGVPQYEQPVELEKPLKGPIRPNPDLQIIPQTQSVLRNVVFRNVTRILLGNKTQQLSAETGTDVVVRDGRLACSGACSHEIAMAEKNGVETILLNDGHFVPPATIFGSTLGMSEIMQEESTQDGENSAESFSRAIDGLILGGKNMHAAFSRGIVTAITAPQFQYGGGKGLSVGFATNSTFGDGNTIIYKEEVALHYSLAKTDKNPTISSHVGALREALLKAARSNKTAILSPEERSLAAVVAGELPLVITAHSADLISSLLRVKAEVEKAIDASKPILLIIHGGAESHLLAEQLAQANVGVVLAPLLSYRMNWDERRALTGAPLTNGTAIDALSAAGVKVAIGVGDDGDWEVRNLYLLAGIAYANGNGKISERQALDFISSNVYDMLGLKGKTDIDDDDDDDAVNQFVVFDGHPLTIEGRVRAVADGSGSVSVWTV